MHNKSRRKYSTRIIESEDLEEKQDVIRPSTYSNDRVFYGRKDEFQLRMRIDSEVMSEPCGGVRGQQFSLLQLADPYHAPVNVPMPLLEVRDDVNGVAAMLDMCIQRNRRKLCT